MSDKPQANKPADEWSNKSIEKFKMQASNLGHRLIVIGAGLLFIAILLAMWIKHVLN